MIERQELKVNVRLGKSVRNEPDDDRQVLSLVVGGEEDAIFVIIAL